MNDMYTFGFDQGFASFIYIYIYIYIYSSCMIFVAYFGLTNDVFNVTMLMLVFDYLTSSGSAFSKQISKQISKLFWRL